MEGELFLMTPRILKPSEMAVNWRTAIQLKEKLAALPIVAIIFNSLIRMFHSFIPQYGLYVTSAYPRRTAYSEDFLKPFHYNNVSY